jgi:hypothetical protein
LIELAAPLPRQVVYPVTAEAIVTPEAMVAPVVIDEVVRVISVLAVKVHPAITVTPPEATAYAEPDNKVVAAVAKVYGQATSAVEVITLLTAS